MHYPETTFIGAGNMAGAVIAGLIKNGYPANKITATSRGAEKLQNLSNLYGIKTNQDNCQAVKNADVIILAVKPFVIQEVCNEIASHINQQLIISIAAGKTISSIKRFLNADNPVIRAMPNTPCLLSKGTIGIFAESGVTTTDQDFVTSLFANIGEVLWMDDEQQIDIVTALSGSGPAYYFYLTEALIKAGIDLGLSQDISTKLVNQTAIGAVAMLNNPPVLSAQALRKAVTSPNGTTEAATHVFDANNLSELVIKAVRAGTDRGREMSVESE